MLEPNDELEIKGLPCVHPCKHQRRATVLGAPLQSGEQTWDPLLQWLLFLSFTAGC